jgi:hypothetical protein
MAGRDEPVPITRHSFWFVLLQFVDPGHHNPLWLQTRHQIVWIIVGPFPGMALPYTPAMPDSNPKIAQERCPGFFDSYRRKD